MSELILSAVAVLISIVSLIVSGRALKSSVKPLLVFVRCDDGIWRIENIGSGPALNITVYDGTRNDWTEAKQYYPVPAGSRSELPALSHGIRLGAAYEDAHGTEYNSICEYYYTRITKGKRPNKWRALVPNVEPFLKEREPIDTVSSKS